LRMRLKLPTISQGPLMDKATVERSARKD
jgi:hypothetical protein